MCGESICLELTEIYSCSRLAVVEKCTAGAQLFAVPGCIAVWDADQVDVTHGLGPAEVKEVKDISVIVIYFFLV